MSRISLTTTSLSGLSAPCTLAFAVCNRIDVSRTKSDEINVLTFEFGSVVMFTFGSAGVSFN